MENFSEYTEKTPETQKEIPLGIGNVISEGGRIIFEVVPRGLLEKINDPRVEYIPPIPLQELFPELLVDGKVKDEELEDLCKERLQWIIYDDAIIQPLTTKIKREFKDYTYNGKHLIGLRGSVCSLDGPILTEDINVAEIESILINGTERGGADSTLISTFDLERDDSQIHHRTIQWLKSSPVGLRKKLINEGEGESSRKIFPILIVYDLNKLRPGSTMNYQALLPTDSQQSSQVILKIYVLDYFDETFPKPDSD